MYTLTDDELKGLVKTITAAAREHVNGDPRVAFDEGEIFRKAVVHLLFSKGQSKARQQMKATPVKVETFSSTKPITNQGIDCPTLTKGV